MGPVYRVNYMPDFFIRLRLSINKRPQKEKKMHTTKTILVVEDDTALRLVVQKVLEMNGYTVIHAEDSVIANAIARSYGGIVDLLLADINLPGLTGGEYGEFMKDVNANLKVLYMSGAPSDSLVRQQLREKTASFIQKPFTNQELLLAVRKALGEIPNTPEDED
jgi:two-component system, cell cycle sensor histidine kinase and response regulator CckA